MKVNDIEMSTEFSSADLESSVEKQRQKEMMLKRYSVTVTAV